MNNELTERLNRILPKLVSDELLSGSGLGNEIGFYVFDYPAEDELRVREHIQFLLDHLPKSKPGLRVKHVNLFDLVIDYLKSRNLLDRAVQMQRTQGISLPNPPGGEDHGQLRQGDHPMRARLQRWCGLNRLRCQLPTRL